MPPSSSIVGYERESCDWMRTVVRHVAAEVVLGTWPETDGGLVAGG
jgi:hypothetical protein